MHYIDYDGGDDYVNGKEGNDTLLFNHDYTSAFEVLTIAGITKIRVGSSASEDYAYDDVKLINVESIRFNNTYLMDLILYFQYESMYLGIQLIVKL